jgi:tetratricopeptide (TPR) repeat protein
VRFGHPLVFHRFFRANTVSRSKKRSSNRRAKRTSLTPERRLIQAQQALEADRFRDAVNHFKELVKSEPRPEYLQGLAASYRGRARELTAKGMFKEALVIWQNRRDACPGEPLDPHYIGLLLDLGHTKEAVQAYAEGAQGLAPKELAALDGRFAAACLAGVSGVEDTLAPEHPVVVQARAARGALAAYCAGDGQALEAELKRIPFRSPYRDWAQILKALGRLPEDPRAAEELLGRVAPESPFITLQRAARLALLPESQFLPALAKADPSQRRFAAILRGWPEARLALWEELQRLGDPPPPRSLLGLVQRYHDRLGKSWMRRHSLRLMIDAWPDSRRWASFRLTELEQALVTAWSHEEQALDHWEVIEAWEGVITQLNRTYRSPGDDAALRMALIQRRLVRRWGLLDSPSQEEAEEWLEQSLEYDPEDLTTYRLLIAHYRAGRRLKDARRLLGPALQRWGDEPELLNEALETAVAGEAFKKAGGFARRILHLDPINRRAKQSLFLAHLSHARKQLAKGRPDLADKELAAAGEWADGAGRSRLDLVAGLALLDRDLAGATGQLTAAVQRLGGGITGSLELAAEASRMGRRPAAVLKKIGLKVTGLPDRDDVLAFCRLLREWREAGSAPGLEVLESFSSPMRAAAKRDDFRKEDSESLCETLRLYGWNDMRLHHARSALKRWPAEPVFEFHAFDAKHGDFLWGAPPSERRRLEQAAERAREAGDTRTFHRIRELLAAGPPAFPFLDDEPEEDFGPGSIELDGMPIEVLLDMLRNSPIGPAIREMEKVLSPEQLREMIRGMMNDPPPLDDDFLPEPPRPRSKRRRKPSGRSRGASTRDKASGRDFPFDQQPDPFDD